MWNFILRVKALVWSAILAVLLSAIAILIAIFNSDAISLVIAFGVSSIVSALLAQRV